MSCFKHEVLHVGALGSVIKRTDEDGVFAPFAYAPGGHLGMIAAFYSSERAATDLFLAAGNLAQGVYIAMQKNRAVDEQLVVSTLDF